MPKLTTQFVEKIRPNPTRRLEIPDSLLPGLYLIVQPSGAKSWAVRYRHSGRTRKYTLDSVARLVLGEARDRAREALKAVSAGRDPAFDKREAKGSDLVRDVVADFLELHVRANNRPRTAEEAARTLKLHVLPKWANRRVQDIARRDVLEVLNAIRANGNPSAANRAFAVIRKFFNWAVATEILGSSPCMKISPPKDESRDRVLNDEELGIAWRGADQLGYPFGTMTQLLILTGQRRNEVAGMRWSEINKTLWTIPGARTKNGRVHEVPLSSVAQAVLAAVPRIAKSDFVLSSKGTSPISGFSKAKTQLDAGLLKLTREEAAASGKNDLSEIRVHPWRLHDLRRTLASGLARLGEPVHVIEAVLNHRNGAISGVAAVYNRHTYLPEKRRALDAWASHVMEFVSERDTSFGN
jgi:integrase